MNTNNIKTFEIIDMEGYPSIEITMEDGSHRYLVMFRMSEFNVMLSKAGGTTRSSTTFDIAEVVEALSFDTAMLVLHGLANEALLEQGFKLNGDQDMVLWRFVKWAYQYAHEHAKCYDINLRNTVPIAVYEMINGN